MLYLTRGAAMPIYIGGAAGSWQGRAVEERRANNDGPVCKFAT